MEKKSVLCQKYDEIRSYDGTYHSYEVRLGDEGYNVQYLMRYRYMGGASNCLHFAKFAVVNPFES